MLAYSPQDSCTCAVRRHVRTEPLSRYLFDVSPAGCRDWKLVSVAHEEGNLNDLRAVLGNDIAIKAYRERKLPFPDGSIIARLAWKYVPSEENNKDTRLDPNRTGTPMCQDCRTCAIARPNIRTDATRSDLMSR